MIRIIGRRLIIPKGDTGFFSLPNCSLYQKGDVAVFSVRDKLTKKTIIEKIDNKGSEKFQRFYKTFRNMEEIFRSTKCSA